MGQYYAPHVFESVDRVIYLSSSGTNPSLKRKIDIISSTKEWAIFVNQGLHEGYLLLLSYAKMTGSGEVPVLEKPFGFYGDYHDFGEDVIVETREVPLYADVTEEHLLSFVYSDFVLFVPVLRSNIASLLLTSSNGGGGGDVVAKVYGYYPPAFPEAFTIATYDELKSILHKFRKSVGLVVKSDEQIAALESDDQLLAKLAVDFRLAVQNGAWDTIVFTTENGFNPEVINP